MNRQSGHRRSFPPKPAQRLWSRSGSITPPSAQPDWPTFDAQLLQLETDVRNLRQRYDATREQLQEQQRLTQRLQEPGLNAATLQRLQQQLDELELQLESSLFDWQTLREPFWQAVRFGGLGIVLGWLFKSLASP